MFVSQYIFARAKIAAEAVALLFIYACKARNELEEIKLLESVPLVVFPVDLFLTVYETLAAFAAASNVNSNKSVVLTGKLAPRAMTVGAEPFALWQRFQFPELATITIPILPVLELVVKSTFVNAATWSTKPINILFPATIVSSPNLKIALKPPNPAASPLHTSKVVLLTLALAPADAPVENKLRLVEVCKLVFVCDGVEIVPDAVTALVPTVKSVVVAFGAIQKYLFSPIAASDPAAPVAPVAPGAPFIFPCKE